MLYLKRIVVEVMIESYLLEYLLAFYEEGSLLKASERLHVSQPSLTRAMQKLESELDVKIFDRNVNKITLNENGKVLIDYVRDIISLNNLLEEKAKELKEKQSLIRTSMTAPGITLYYSYFFFSNHKNFENKICDQKTCIKETLEGIVDLAFINEKISDERLICEKIVDENLYVCLPKEHFLANKEAVTFNELDGQSFLLGYDLGVWDEIVKRRLSKSKFIKLERENLEEVAKYSSIPRFQTNLSLKFDERKDKIRIPIVGEETSLTFYAIYRPNKKKIFDYIKLSR